MALDFGLAAPPVDLLIQPDGDKPRSAPLDLGLIHEAVLAQARLTPGAVAVRVGDRSIDYVTLIAGAHVYAEVLRGFGVGPGDVVPVCLPRGAELAALLLAVLDCGAAYAAFDPRWPSERRAALIARLAGPVYATREHDDAPGEVWLVPSTPLEVVAATTANALHDPLDAFPRPAISSDAAACVFFTSGTTGQPKAVVSPHRATTRLFSAAPGAGLPGLQRGAVMPQAAPAPWDAFNLELWGMLTVGGTVAVVEDDYLLPGMLRDLINDAGANVLWLTASLFNTFIDMDLDCFAGVTHVYSGGERLSAAHVRRFVQRYPDVELRNGYGPVESCVFATSHLITLADCDLEAGIPVGSAVPATQLHILDADQSLPLGEAGEICVAGDGLALEYLGDPDQTAAKFVTVELAGVSTRLYRTGDKGFLDEAGVVHFRGRIDRQVKIRGYRIEPGEIEFAAASLASVRSCAVVPVPGRSQVYERLALFFVPADGSELPADAAADDDRFGIVDELFDRLPEYLVPEIVYEVPALPLTANGKLDSAALLARLS